MDVDRNSDSFGRREVPSLQSAVKEVYCDTSSTSFSRARRCNGQPRAADNPAGPGRTASKQHSAGSSASRPEAAYEPTRQADPAGRLHEAGACRRPKLARERRPSVLRQASEELLVPARLTEGLITRAFCRKVGLAVAG